MRVSAVIHRTLGAALAFACVSQAVPAGFGTSSSHLELRANTGDCPVPRPLTGACRQVCQLNETPQWSGLCLCKAPFVASVNQRPPVCEPVCTSGFRINAAGTGCECPASSFLTATGTCVTACAASTFAVPSTVAGKPGSCASCPATFATCSSRTFATSCVQGFELVSRNCAPICVGATVLSPRANKCIPCTDASAATCFFTASLTCIPGFSLTSGVCKPTIKDCSRNFYLDTSANVCVRCTDPKAFTCSKDTALTCAGGRIVVNKACVVPITCSPGSAAYYEPTTNACIPCGTGTLSCSASESLTCGPFYSLINKACQRTSCAETYEYIDIAANTCKMCSDWESFTSGQEGRIRVDRVDDGTSLGYAAPRQYNYVSVNTLELAMTLQLTGPATGSFNLSISGSGTNFGTGVESVGDLSNTSADNVAYAFLSQSPESATLRAPSIWKFACAGNEIRLEGLGVNDSGATNPLTTVVYDAGPSSQPLFLTPNLPSFSAAYAYAQFQFDAVSFTFLPFASL